MGNCYLTVFYQEPLHVLQHACMPKKLLKFWLAWMRVALVCMTGWASGQPSPDWSKLVRPASYWPGPAARPESWTGQGQEVTGHTLSLNESPVEEIWKWNTVCHWETCNELFVLCLCVPRFVKKPISTLETGMGISFFQSHVRVKNFILSISFFETRTRITFFNLRLQDKNEK